MGDLLGSVIGSAGSIIGDVANLFGQSAANRQAEKYAENQLQEQRQWALQDVASQNAYNSPVEQMQRLTAAGLNPNLVYGEGIQAAGQEQQPRSTPSASFTPQNTLSSFSNLGSQLEGSLAQATDISKTEEETKNLGKTRLNIIQDTANKAADLIQKQFTNTYNDLYGAANKEAESETKRSEASIADQHATQEDIKTFIAQQSKDLTLKQIMEAYIQSKIKSTSDQVLQNNLRKAGDILDQNKQLNQLSIQSQSWDFNANSPVWQQVIQKVLGALLSHVSKP